MSYPRTFHELPPGVKRIRYYPRIGSTNTRAKQLAERGAPDGTVVLADAQSAGRGRQGRPWHSPPGKGLYFSVLLRPPRLEPAALAALPLVAAVSAAGQLRAVTGTPVAVKWPNDLLVDCRKIGGILAEARASGRDLRYAVLGIGLNINHRPGDFPAHLRERATSLHLIHGREFDRTPLLLALLGEITRHCRLFFETGFAPFRPRWEEMSVTLGSAVALHRPGGMLRGQAVGIDDTGALLVEDCRGERHRIIWGEID